MKKDVLDALLHNLAIPAVATAVGLYTNGISFLIFVPLVVAAFLASLAFQLRKLRALRAESELAAFSAALEALYSDLGVAKMSLQNSLRDVVCKLEGMPDSVSGYFTAIRSRLALGQSLSGAVSMQAHGTPPELTVAIHRIKQEYDRSGNAGVSFKHASDEIRAKLRSRAEYRNASLSKSVAVSTVLSTVAPSLSMFAFVSYLIVAYSQLSFMLLTITLLSVIPTLSTIIGLNIHENR